MSKRGIATLGLAVAAVTGAIVVAILPAPADPPLRVHLGPRPFHLIDTMIPGPLARALERCREEPVTPREFSIGHRGAPLQFPEHTRESYEAAARMGAGMLECDVTFTRDRELVCRHSPCDLHTTTNVLATPLGAKCTKPFVPADPSAGTAASARCCTTDFTLAELRTLCGKMDGADASATTVADYLRGTPPWRTELYASCGTLVSHADAIALFRRLGAKHVPELKVPKVARPDGDFGRREFARRLIDEYREAGVSPDDVYPRSFDLEDVRFWIAEEPEFGRQAVWIDGRARDNPRFDANEPSSWSPTMAELVRDGVRFVSPPIPTLLTLDASGRIVSSAYASAARDAGLRLFTWTLERESPLTKPGGFFTRSIAPALSREGDVFEILHVLARDVGVRGVFSDWPATTTYYANCFGLK